MYGEYLASFQCTLIADPSATVINTAAPVMDKAYTFDLGPHLDGQYAVAITQTDRAGNTSPAAVDTFALYRAAPNAPLTGPVR